MIAQHLTDAEILQACVIGCMRTIKGKRLVDPSKQRKKEQKASQWHLDIEGACAEMAYAKARDKFWSAAWDTFKEPDVGPVQIRHTELQHGCLIVRPDDKDHEPFALVTGTAPDFIIVGWMLAGDAKRDIWAQGLNTNEPYWRVPQSALFELFFTDLSHS